MFSNNIARQEGGAIYAYLTDFTGFYKDLLTVVTTAPAKTTLNVGTMTNNQGYTATDGMNFKGDGPFFGAFVFLNTKPTTAFRYVPATG